MRHRRERQAAHYRTGWLWWRRCRCGLRLLRGRCPDARTGAPYVYPPVTGSGLNAARQPVWNQPTAQVPNLPADRPLLTPGQLWRGNGGRWP